MGSQRVASAVINRNATAGASATNPGAETDLQEALECMGLTVNTDFVMSTLLENVDYEEEITQAEYEQLHPAVYRDCNDDPACLCGLDAYWTEQLTTIECSDYNIMYWYHPDYLGNTEFVTDFEGNAYQSFWYSPWGETLNQRNSFAATWGALHRFNAAEIDFETGAIYMSARYYRAKDHPGFLSVDPLATQFPHMNPYNFALNNPVNLVDPTGMAPVIPGDGDPTKPPKVDQGPEQIPQGGNPNIPRPVDNGARSSTSNPSQSVDLNAPEYIGGPGMLEWASTGGVVASIKSIGSAIKGLKRLYAMRKAYKAAQAAKAAKAAESAAKGSKLYSEATFKAFQKQLQQHGKSSLLKSQSKIQRRLNEHLKKLDEIKKSGGHASSVEREINTFKSQLQAIGDLLK